MNATFWGLLEEVTHNGFMAGTFFLTALTLFIFGLVVNRMRPKRWRETEVKSAFTGTLTVTTPVQVASAHEHGYRRPTWQDALFELVPERWRNPSAARVIEHLPVIVIVAMLSALSLRLYNTAFIDEALYINAGRDYIGQWLHGTPTSPFGASFSGAPLGYPVFAGALDMVGGLRLARLFSLVCMVVTVLCLQSTMRRVHSRRAGLLAACVFAVTGPVAYIGALATFDALCVALLALTLWLGITRDRGSSSDVLTGAVLATAVVVKYTAAVFAPVALVLIFLTTRRPLDRLLVTATTTAGLLGAAFLLWGDGVAEGILFTTAGREAMSPTPRNELLGWMTLDIGALIVLAVIGAAILSRAPRTALISVTLLGAAAILPAAQMRLGEAVSFDKHTAYAALFLAPLAGVALASLSCRLFRLVPVIPIIMLALLFGFTRSDAMFSSWVNVSPVIQAINENPQPGIYLSSATDSLKYHLREDHPQIQWQTTFELYAKGPEAIRAEVRSQRLQTVILRTASTGSPDQDAGQETLIEALRLDPHYVLRPPVEVRPGSLDHWLIFSQRDTA